MNEKDLAKKIQDIIELEVEKNGGFVDGKTALKAIHEIYSQVKQITNIHTEYQEKVGIPFNPKQEL